MRANLILTMIAGFFLMPFGAYAQVSVQSFSWQDNSRFELRLTENGRPVGIKGELGNGAQQMFKAKDRPLTVQLKSYTTELFVVMTITHEDDDMGYVFLFERPQTVWMVMNQVPIRASKLEIMENIQTVMKDFATVSNFTLATSMRKTVDYFAKNPNNRLEDLLNALENRDASLRELPRPRGNLDRGNQGVRPGRPPKNAPLAEEGQEVQQEEEQIGDRNARRRGSPPPYVPPRFYDPRRDSQWGEGPSAPPFDGREEELSPVPLPVPVPNSMRSLPRGRDDRSRRYDVPRTPPPDVEEEFEGNEWDRRRRPPPHQYRQPPPPRPQRWQQYAPPPVNDYRREPPDRGGGTFLDDYFQ